MKMFPCQHYSSARENFSRDESPCLSLSHKPKSERTKRKSKQKKKDRVNFSFFHPRASSFWELFVKLPDIWKKEIV